MMIDDVFTANGPGDVPGTEGYTEAADALIQKYESFSFEQCHQPELHVLPTVPCRVLDVGAGSGRDAAWFAAQGHSVLAVEPTAALRTAAMVLHPSRSIEWLDDSLPDVAMVVGRNQLFDFILLSAVWMHLDASERHAGMRTLASLLSRNGTLVMPLRHGPLPFGRRMFDVSAEETITIAARNGLRPVLNVRCDSIQASNRAVGVTWTQLAFGR
jgi:SAM-dependent methyltransferase